MRPADPPARNLRGPLLAASALVLVALGVWLFLPAPDESPADAPAVATEGPAARPRALTATEVADPEESRRLAEREQRRGRYDAMRGAWDASRRESPGSRARLEPALATLWPGLPRPFGLACRELLCRVELPQPAQASGPALAGDPGVHRLAEEVLVDPDGGEAAAYVLLAPANASPGDGVLSAVGQELTRSREARECLSSVGAVGTVEYDLRVDVTGFTYRTRTDLPREVQECVDSVLNRIVATTDVPPEVKGASLRVALRR